MDTSNWKRSLKSSRMQQDFFHPYHVLLLQFNSLNYFSLCSHSLTCIMAVEKERWLRTKFTKESMPNWPCPTCGIGQLPLEKDWARRALSSVSANENPAYLDQFPSEVIERFAGIVRCSNTSCKETVSVNGLAGNEELWDDQGMQNLYTRFYQPVFFYPPLHIFRIDNHCPNQIKEQIIKSFSHYFNDPWAAANAVRTSLEFIMDYQKVNKVRKSGKGKNIKLTLHERIDLFGNAKPDLKPFLMAAKWIGNAGSHTTEIGKESVLDGYALLEHAIYELYSKKKNLKVLAAKAKAINKSRKPTKRKPS